MRDHVCEAIFGKTERGVAMKCNGAAMPLVAVTDTKNAFDRLTSDAGVGSSTQKSVKLEMASDVTRKICRATS